MMSTSAFSQKGGDDIRNLQEQVALLIDDVHSKGLISEGMKDSISRFVAEPSNLRTDNDFDRMVTLRNYLMRSLLSPNIYSEMKKEILPEKLDAPMSDKGCISKGVDDFYKNKRGMKYIGMGWDDPEGDALAAKKAVASISSSLPIGQLPSTPAFINNLSNSNNFFLKTLGGLLRSFNNGTQM